MVGSDDYIDDILEGYGKKTLEDEMEEGRKLRKALWAEEVAAYEADAADYAGGALDTGAANDKLDRLLDGDDYRVPDDVFGAYLSTTEEMGWDVSPGSAGEESEGPGMALLRDRYRQWAEQAGRTDDRTRLRRHARSAAEGLDVSAGALYTFGRETPFSGDDGYWLAWIMEESSDDLFLLPDMTDVDFVGAWNTKTVLVDGDVGDAAGYEMRGGLLCVKGEAGAEFGGWMEAGTAIANQGVGEAPGRRMKGGELIVPDPGAVDVEGKGGRVAGLLRDAF